MGAKRHGKTALELVELIYEAVVKPDSWTAFLERLSEALGGVAIQLSLRLPDVLPTADAFFRVGLDEEYHGMFLKHVLEGLPWGSIDDDIFRGRFGLASEVVPDEDIGDTAFFNEFMKPQGLAAKWPICNLIHTQEGHPLSGMVIYQREEGSEIDADDLALLDSLAPHLVRAYAIHCQLAQVRQERRALTEVIDRLPLGVVLLDAEKHAVLMNRSAEEILSLDDGFRLERERPVIGNARENRALQTCLATALTTQIERGSSAGGDVMAVTRPSGRRAFPLMVGPLLAAHPDSTIDEAKAVLFIGNPEGGHISTTEVLETLYQLTHAEAELVRLMAEGYSLEEVAEERGVTMNTVRSQLKQVFAKTDTSRQGELVHLVLTGVASVREGEGF